jgi:hypothetical protein
VKWGKKEMSDTVECKALAERISSTRSILTERRKVLTDLAKKYQSLIGLIERNKESPAIPDITQSIKLPYLVIASSDDPGNQLSIRLNENNSKVWLSFIKPFKIVGDIDTVLQFRTKKCDKVVPVRVEELINRG